MEIGQGFTRKNQVIDIAALPKLWKPVQAALDSWQIEPALPAAPIQL